jgi:hypothetical protein
MVIVRREFSCMLVLDCVGEGGAVLMGVVLEGLGDSLEVWLVFIAGGYLLLRSTSDW